MNDKAYTRKHTLHTILGILHLPVYTLETECQTYSLADTSKAVYLRQTVSLALRK